MYSYISIPPLTLIYTNKNGLSIINLPKKVNIF
nr:MAG TPA: hypothetical protein [Caudoviricetes sp.]DAZ36535.1 MAG TPA: hypothetical protein [Caudoviricetes sp.]